MRREVGGGSEEELGSCAKLGGGVAEEMGVTEGPGLGERRAREARLQPG